MFLARRHLQPGCFAFIAVCYTPYRDWKLYSCITLFFWLPTITVQPWLSHETITRNQHKTQISCNNAHTDLMGSVALARPRKANLTSASAHCARLTASLLTHDCLPCSSLVSCPSLLQTFLPWIVVCYLCLKYSFIFISVIPSYHTTYCLCFYNFLTAPTSQQHWRRRQGHFPVTIHSLFLILNCYFCCTYICILYTIIYPLVYSYVFTLCLFIYSILFYPSFIFIILWLLMH